ncbi:DUF1801 domain-containing protein [Nocardioides sp. GXZ039]|uniref:DUF1801 domain-containing protein n=1 Tax=Nocardioides sp. GXZ039 TaxID=3136018 RepID=UPI0030F37B92
MGSDAAKKIDELIDGLDDWRGPMLAEVRALIREALPDVEEEWKWMGSPVWEQDGIVAVGNAHKAKVKLTFPEGAHLEDPTGLLASGNGKHWRAIDLAEGDKLNKRSFKALVKRAAAYNAAKR